MIKSTFHVIEVACTLVQSIAAALTLGLIITLLYVHTAPLIAQHAPWASKYLWSVLLLGVSGLYRAESLSKKK